MSIYILFVYYFMNKQIIFEHLQRERVRQTETDRDKEGDKKAELTIDRCVLWFLNSMKNLFNLLSTLRT